MSCHAISPDPDRILWRTRVRRLAAAFGRNDDRDQTNWYDRACAACRQAHKLNARIYPRDEPWCCGDSLYDPTVKRDGYWWACLIDGEDPEAPCGTVPSAERRMELARLLHESGLAVTGESIC